MSARISPRECGVDVVGMDSHGYYYKAEHARTHIILKVPVVLMIIYTNQVTETQILLFTSVAQGIWSLSFSLTTALLTFPTWELCFMSSSAQWVLMFVQAIHLEAKV